MLLGTVMRSVLPSHYLSDAKDVVRLGTGLIGTIAALVLGLLIASAKASYDTQSAHVRQMEANVILLDLMLADYGSETHEIRELMRRSVMAWVERVWQQGGLHPAARFEAIHESEIAFAKIQELLPRSEAQRSLKARAVQLATDLAQTRLLLFTTQRDHALPMPFLAILVFWLTIIFASFNLFVQPNPVVVGALMIFAISSTGAIYLILELSHPFTGLLQVSSEPLRTALMPLNR
jgi:hypothetical protein